MKDRPSPPSLDIRSEGDPHENVNHPRNNLCLKISKEKRKREKEDYTTFKYLAMTGSRNFHVIFIGESPCEET